MILPWIKYVAYCFNEELGAGRWSGTTPVLKILVIEAWSEKILNREYYVIQSTFIKMGLNSPESVFRDDETLSKTRAQEIFLSIKEEQYATVKKIEKEYLKEPLFIL